MRKRQILVAAVVLLLLAGIVSILGSVLGWPPPGIILRHGMSPTVAATGETRVVAGIEFVRVPRGASRVDRHGWDCFDGDWLGRVSAHFGISLGTPPHHAYPGCRYWAEVDAALWISRTCVSSSTEDIKAYVNRIGRSLTGDMEWSARWLGERLTRRHAGVFRLPRRSEWDHAVLTGAVTRRDSLGPYIVIGPEGKEERLWAVGYRGYRGSSGPVFRLVWIPPVDE